MFTAIVGSKDGLSGVQKLLYLQSCLKGEALSLISSLPVTNENYQVAWNALVKHYDDTNLLTNLYLDALLEITPITRNPVGMRRFVTIVSENLGALEALGHEVESWVVLLVH